MSILFRFSFGGVPAAKISALLRTPCPLSRSRMMSAHTWRTSVVVGVPMQHRGICHTRSSYQGVVHTSDSSSAAAATPTGRAGESLPELPQRVFDNLSFPAKFTLKIIGLDEASFVSDTLATLTRIVGVDSLPASGISTRPKGKYLSITATPVFSDSSQIYACYAKLKEDPRVKFVL